MELVEIYLEAVQRRSFEHPVRRQLGMKHMEQKDAVESWSSDVFSFHRVKSICSDSNLATVTEIPIEPLVGALRHPFYHCFPHKKDVSISGPKEIPFLLNKDYFLPSLKREVYPALKFNNAFLFDIGASTYLSGAGGASQSWFVDTYARAGIKFDRIFAWEMTPMADITIFESVPPHILNTLSYFNVPADPRPGALHNPLRYIAEIAKPEDFVVVKLDIDTSHVETEFIRQILSDINLSSRIDELYYEHHVSDSPVHWQAWGNSVGSASLPESYRNFSALRKLGIRAHAWV
jgi:hypothetical protein